MTESLQEKLLPETLQWAQEMAQCRQDIHKHPDLGYETERTQAKIAAFLKEHGFEHVDTELSKGCVVAVLEGNRPGATIGIRADMDALPMTETAGKPYDSVNPGIAHCCGHDGHTTWLMYAARYLSEHRDFPGKIVFVFQAAEEKGTGAQALVDNGLFNKYPMDEIYGAHSEPNLPVGTVGFKPGPLQAASDMVYITVKGHGCHGGRPHQGIDPIPVACQIVMAAQTIVSRKVDPIESGVVSLCSINAGRWEAANVVPPQCTISGTIRTFLPQVRDLCQENLVNMVNGIAKANGCEVECDYQRVIGSVINSEEQANAAIEATRELLGDDHVQIIKPFMSSEDFSVFLDHVPGNIMRVGMRDETHTAGLHNTAFDFNDKALPVAVSVICNMARRRLETLAAR